MRNLASYARLAVTENLSFFILLQLVQGCSVMYGVLVVGIDNEPRLGVQPHPLASPFALAFFSWSIRMPSDYEPSLN